MFLLVISVLVGVKSATFTVNTNASAMNTQVFLLVRDLLTVVLLLVQKQLVTVLFTLQNKCLKLVVKIFPVKSLLFRAQVT